ncbi:MAG: hypothetical protein J6S95_02210 [Lachnospiraceae bacterium]|nr:hypothetical protein [Lachnospiraceae bacterium]
MSKKDKALFHLPGLFEFYELYKAFFSVFYKERDMFYPWAFIASVYGAPGNSLWAGGRFEEGYESPERVLGLLKRYGISARLTFSNSLLAKEHLSDRKCNRLCKQFEESGTNGVIVHSEILTAYLKERYPGLYLVSSTTKVLTDFEDLLSELRREEFLYVVPDFRLNKQLDKLCSLTDPEKDKVEFLVNECCHTGCTDRKACYENVSRRMLSEDVPEHICKAPFGNEGYDLSRAKENPSFIGPSDIVDTYLKNGFSNFKIEGRGLSEETVLELLLYYLAKPENISKVKELVYLNL